MVRALGRGRVRASASRCTGRSRARRTSSSASSSRIRAARVSPSSASSRSASRATHRQLVAAPRHGAPAPCAPAGAGRARSPPGREQAEQVHLRRARTGPLRPVEHLEHAERALVVEQRHRHQPLRDVARLLGDLAREARVASSVLDRRAAAAWRAPSRRCPVPAGSACRRSVSSPSPATASKTSSSALLVEEQDRRRLGAEDRARDLDDRAEQRAVALLRAEHAGRDGRAQLVRRSRAPPTLSASGRARS